MSEVLLDYLTIFRSRLGVVNLVLPLVELSATRVETVTRKLREILEERVEIDPSNQASEGVLTYLVDKQLVGPRPRKRGRYAKYTLQREGSTWEARTARGDLLLSLPVFKTDLWFSDARVRSTVGVPTPDNVDEVLGFCLDLGVVSKVRGSRTTAGHVMAAMRKTAAQSDNPFVLGLESAALLRHVLSRDALVLCELTRELGQHGEVVRRDDLLPGGFIEIARRAYELSRTLDMGADVVGQARAFSRLLEETSRKKVVTRAAAKGAVSEGPGVLEHRLSPRLEWLTDFGILTKDGLAKNSFSYRQTPLVGETQVRLEAQLRGRNTPADDTALELRSRDPEWEELRRAVRVHSVEDALVAGFRSIQMAIGPVPIREVCFIAAAHLDPIPPVEQLREELLRWAERESGIKLAGGRYRREPEMVRFSEKMLT